jgi:hypothetical protein
VLLSAALIVRDEQAHLAACLDRLTEVVDQVVVVDTGSLDDSPAIARACGAELLTMEWTGDFARARNRALDAAVGDWILYIDADERLTAGDELHRVLGGPEGRDAVAGLVLFRAATRWTPYREHRLFRNRPDLRFRGRIHESVVPDIERIVATEGATIIEVPARIDHLGYDGDMTAKRRRNLPLLEDAVTRDPDRTYLWFDLGLSRLGLDDPGGAEQAWADGVRQARAQGRFGPIELLLWAELALLRLRSTVTAAEADRTVDDLVDEMVAAFPDDPLTLWVRANQAMASHRWSDAVDPLERLLAVDADTVVHQVMGYDRGLFGEWAQQALGAVAFHLGDDAAAARWFAAAAAANPDNPEYAVKHRLAAARAGSHPD